MQQAKETTFFLPCSRKNHRRQQKLYRIFSTSMLSWSIVKAAPMPEALMHAAFCPDCSSFPRARAALSHMEEGAATSRGPIWGGTAGRRNDMKSNIYSGLDRLPQGRASDIITPGCLVLEGGALRGTYSVGVMDALMEDDVNLQCTVGVSAGALNGISYVSGQIGRSARSPLRYRHDARYFGFGAFLRNRSPFGFDFMFGELSRTLDPLDMERFMRPERRFVAVATNCRTGRAEYFEKGACSDILLATRASSTMPYISRMVAMDDALYLDGGCSCKIPVEWALEQDFQHILVIKTRPDGYRRNPAAGRKLARLFYGRTWPRLAESLAGSNADYNRLCDLIETLRRKGRVFVISPSRFMDIGRMEKDMEKLGEWYWLGYHDAKNVMAELKGYLGRDVTQEQDAATA